MGLVLDEKKEAENIIESGEIGKSPTSTLFLLAKYYKNVKKYKSPEIVERLSEFMSTNYPGYIKSRWEDIIEHNAKIPTKYKLLVFEDGIKITKSEIDIVKNCGGIWYQKLLFVMLVYAKYSNFKSEKNNNNNWVNAEIPELFKAARVTVKHRNDKFLMINDLTEKGLIELSNKNENLNMRVTFVENITPESDIALSITDGRELAYEYLQYIGHSQYVKCTICERLVKKTNNKIMYCNECRQLVNLANKRDWDRENRKSEK